MRVNYLRSLRVPPPSPRMCGLHPTVSFFMADSTSSPIDAVNSMGLCVDAVRCWVIKDKLCLNDNQTEFIIVGTRQHLAKVIFPSRCVGDANKF